MRPTISTTLGALLSAWALAGCQPAMDPIVPDLERPYIIGIVPSGNSVAADAEFVIRFSKPVQERTIFWFDEDLGEDLPEGIVLAKGDDEEYMRKAANTMPLTVTQRKKSIPVDVRLSPTRELAIVKPLHPLEGLTDYVLIVSRRVRDDHFNSLIRAPGSTTPETMVFSFTTAPAPDLTPPKTFLKNPAPGSQGVSIELAQVVVEFSEEIALETLARDRIGLKVRDTGETILPASVTVDDLRATLVLADDSREDCDKLCLDQEYELWVSSRVEDLAGNGMSRSNLAEEFFKSATCIDEHPPRIADSSLAAQASDVSVTITWRTDEASTSQVQLVKGDTDSFYEACESEPTEACIVVHGADSACQADVCALSDSQGDWACEHRVTVGGLTPQTTYSFRVTSADAGNRSVDSAVMQVETLAPLPKVVITEVFATPQGLANVNAGKFIELFNAGTVDVDLAGWKLARCADAACSVEEGSKWVLAGESGGSSVLTVGSYAVAAGKVFDAAAMGVPAEALQLRGSTDTLLANGLVSGSAKTYVLLTPEDLLVSAYGGWLGVPSAEATKTKPKNNGKSFERIDPLGPDEAANWRLSTAEIAGAPSNFATPGRKNSASP